MADSLFWRRVSMWCFASCRGYKYLRALAHELLLDKVDT
jgi:hypothetical protein